MTAVTPSGVRDGDPAALAGLCDRRGPAVLAYCREVAGDAAATAAAAEAFARFRAAVVATDDPTRVNPEALLLSATRHAAVRHSRGPAAGLCADVPRLLAARADRSISLAELERLEAHLVMCASCRAPVERFQAAERAYRDPPSTSMTPEQGAVIVAALAAAAPVRSIVPLASSVEAPAVIPAAPEPEPQPVDAPLPVRDDEPPAIEPEPDAEPAFDEQPPAAEQEPVTQPELIADAQPADEPPSPSSDPAGDERRRGIDAESGIDAEPADERLPSALEPEPEPEPEIQPAEEPDPLPDAPPALHERPSDVEPEPVVEADAVADEHPEPQARPDIDAQPAAVEPEPVAHAEAEADERPATARREPVNGAERAVEEQATGVEQPTLEPAPASDPGPEHATVDRPAVTEPAFAVSAPAIHARDERSTSEALPLAGAAPPAHAAGGDRPAVELAPLTAAARRGTGRLSPLEPEPEPEPASQAPVRDAPTTEHRVIDDFELSPDAPDLEARSANGAPAAQRAPARPGGFGENVGPPPFDTARVPAMRRAGGPPGRAGGTGLPRMQRAPAAGGGRTSGAAMRPSIVLPVALVALSLVVALFVAGVFASDDRAPEAGTTVPGALPATATTTPEIVVVPGAHAASAAEVERAKARARAQRRREAKLSGAPEEPGSERASAPVRDEGGAVVDASPAPARAPSPAADASPPAADPPRGDTGGTGVDADSDSTGGRQVPPSQDASNVPDLAPPPDQVTPP